MLRPDYPITTERLLIRPYTEDDLDAFYRIFSRDDVARYLEYGPFDRAAVREGLSRRVRRSSLQKAGDALTLAVALRDDGTLIGDVMLSWLSEINRQGEIGFVFHPDHQGKGYAKEAALKMLWLGFEEVGLHRIIAGCDPRNTPSWGLMEGLGMRREAHFRECEIVKGDWRDLYVYAMLASEWKLRAVRG